MSTYNLITKTKELIVIQCQCGQSHEINLRPNEPKEKFVGIVMNDWKIIEYIGYRGMNKYFKCQCVKCEEQKEFSYSNFMYGKISICKCSKVKKERKTNKEIEPDFSELLKTGIAKIMLDRHLILAESNPSLKASMIAAGLIAQPGA